MGIDIIRLGEQGHTNSATPLEATLSQLTYHEFFVPQPQMNIWLVYADNTRPLFPWWSFDSRLEQDIDIVNEVWDVSSQQSFFDCLFLSTLQKTMGNNFYVVFPGIIKSHNWAHVKPADRNLYLSGQGCVYHLMGTFDKKLSIQWVPFWQPQSLVKDPYFISLWRLFRLIHVEDMSKSITFFQLSDPQKLPKVLTLLNDAEENRSEKLSELVDSFGMYSSPVQDLFKPGCIFYAREKQALDKLAIFREQFDRLYKEAQKSMSLQPEPRSILRFLSGHIAL